MFWKHNSFHPDCYHRKRQASTWKSHRFRYAEPVDQFFQTARFPSRLLFELFPIYNNNSKDSCFILNETYMFHRSNYLIISHNVTIYGKNIFTHFYHKFHSCFLRFVDQKWNRRPQQENTCCIVRCGSWKKKLVMKKEFVYTRALQKASLLLLWLIAHQEIPGSANDLLFHFWSRMSRWGGVIRKTSFKFIESATFWNRIKSNQVIVSLSLNYLCLIQYILLRPVSCCYTKMSVSFDQVEVNRLWKNWFFTIKFFCSYFYLYRISSKHLT